MTKEEVVKDFKDLCEDFKFNDDIFCEDDPKVAKLKYIIQYKLTRADRIIIYKYADDASLRKLGQKMGLSHMTLHKQIVRIRKHILEEYMKL